MDTSRGTSARTPLALLVLLTALVPLAACQGGPESAQAADADNTAAVQQAVDQAENPPMEPVPPVVQPSMQPDAPATDATPAAPATTATAPRPRPTPRPAVPASPAPE